MNVIIKKEKHPGHFQGGENMNEFFVLNDNTKIPKIGFGTYNEEFEDNRASILKAIETGYRFFDTASLYETERSLGAAIKDSGIARSDVIIETKLWIDEMGAENARIAVEKIIGSGNEYFDSEVVFTKRAKRVLETAWEHAKQQNKTKIESSDLLWAITTEPTSLAMQALEALGTDVVEIREGIKKHTKG